MESKLYVHPPDFQKCQKHCQATRIWKGINENTSNEKCQCCNSKLGQQKVKCQFCYNPLQLAFLGPGVPLFFTYLRNCIILIVLMSIVFAAFGIYSNLAGGTCMSTKVCESNIFNTLSIINKATVFDFMSIQNYICFAFVVICIFMFQRFRYNCRMVQEKCDKLIDTPSDYSIILRRLPENCQPCDIQKMIVKKRGQLSKKEQIKTQNLRLQEIILSYKLDEYVKVQAKNLEQFKRHVKENRKSQFIPQALPEPMQTATIAVVVFQRQASKQIFVYQPNICQNILQCLCNPCVPLSDYLVKDQKVSIQRAPQPDDIIWQNAGVSVTEGIYRKSCYNLLAIIMLAIGAGVQYGFSVVQNSFTDESTIFLMGIVSSVAVSALNLAIQLLIQFTSAREKNETLSEYNSILMVKIALFQFLNASFILVFANILADLENFNIYQGISAKATQIMILNALTNTASSFFLYFFNIFGKIKRLLIKMNLFFVTQLEANQAFELQSIDFPYKYSYLLKTIWLTAFYAPLVPIVVPISVAGLLLYYWVEKSLFGGSYKVPNMVSSMINETAIKLMEYFPLILTIGQFLVYFYFKNFNFAQVPENWSIPIYIALGLSLINLLIPMGKINRKIFKLKANNTNNLSYTQVRQKFQVTYQITYPAHYNYHKRERDQILCRMIRQRNVIEPEMELQTNRTNKPLRTQKKNQAVNPSL